MAELLLPVFILSVVRTGIRMAEEKLLKSLKKAKNRKSGKKLANASQVPEEVVSGSDEQKIEAKPSTRWKCIGTSVIGASHLKYSFCQDYSLYAELDSGELITVVSDGASSAKHAHRGAQLACEAALSNLQQALTQCRTSRDWQELLTNAFDGARIAIEEESTLQQISVSEYAATLLVMIFTKETVACGMVGDGTIVAVDKDGKLEYVLLPQRGEYANEACFLTSKAAPQALDIRVIEYPLQAAALLTDGLLGVSGNYKKRKPHVGFFHSVFNFVCATTDPQAGIKELQNFLMSERVNKYTDDDKTLVLIVDAQLSEVGIHDEALRQDQSRIYSGETDSEPRGGQVIHDTEQSPASRQDLPRTKKGARRKGVLNDKHETNTTTISDNSLANEGVIPKKIHSKN